MDYTPPTIKTVISRDEFVAAIADCDGSTPAHVLLLCTFAEISDLFILFRERDSLYSVIALEDSAALRTAAARVDTVPIFVVSSEDDALDTVRRLVEFPRLTVLEAVNGEIVASRYAEGNPT